MKRYKIYKSPLGMIEAVKTGWSWPGFLFTLIWLLVKKLYVTAGMVFLIAIIIGFVEFEVGVTGLSSFFNLFIGVVGTVNDPGDFTLNANIPVAIAANDVLTFVYPAAPSVSVLTLDNQTVTISSPAEGFVLPLSVAQITGTSNGLSNIIAFE